MNDRRKTLEDIEPEFKMHPLYVRGYERSKEEIKDDMRYINSISKTPIEYQSRIKRYFKLK